MSKDDNLQIGTDSDVVGNLKTIAQNIARIAVALGDGRENETTFVVPRILRYAGREAHAAASAIRTDIGLLAWRSRNLFESYLILKACLNTPDRAKTLIAQKAADELAIYEGLTTMGVATGIDVQPLKERSEYIMSFLRKHGYDKKTAQPWICRDLAKSLGLESEYTAFYKLFSKYVHPSGWLMLSDEDEILGFHYWEGFIVKSQTYAQLCRETGLQFATSKGIIVQQD